MKELKHIDQESFKANKACVTNLWHPCPACWRKHLDEYKPDITALNRLQALLNDPEAMAKLKERAEAREALNRKSWPNNLIF